MSMLGVGELPFQEIPTRLLRTSIDPTSEVNTIGFRVARGVPEPGTLLMVALLLLPSTAVRNGHRG